MGQSSNSQMAAQVKQENVEDELTNLGLGLSGQKRGPNDGKNGEGEDEGGTSGQNVAKKLKKE